MASEVDGGSGIAAEVPLRAGCIVSVFVVFVTMARTGTTRDLR